MIHFSEIRTICPGRGFDDALTVLKADFNGVLIRDGWAPYRCFDDALHQTCVAHLLRRCKHLRDDHPDSAWAVQLEAVLQAGLALRDRRDDGALTDHGLASVRGRLLARLGRLIDAPPPLEGGGTTSRPITGRPRPSMTTSSWPGSTRRRRGTVKLTKSSSIDPQDTGLEPAVNPPCWRSETAVSLNLTISWGPLLADVLVLLDNLDARSCGHAGHERRRSPTQQAKHSGKRVLQDKGLLVPRQPGSCEHKRLDLCLAQGLELDPALADLLVLRDQDPAPSTNEGEPLHVLRAAPEGVALHVRDMSFVAQHVRNRPCRDTLVNEELVRVVRRRGRG